MVRMSTPASRMSRMAARTSSSVSPMPTMRLVFVTRLGACCFANRSTRNYYRQGNGLGYFVSYNKTGRNFGWVYNGNGRTQDYRADVGFTRRVNTNRHDVFVRFSNDPNPKRKLISWRLVYSTDVNFDWQRDMQNWGSGPRLNLQLHHNTSLELSADFGYDRLFEQEFGARRTATHAGAFFGGPERSTYQGSFTIGMQTNPIKQFSGHVSVDNGWNQFDFDFGAAPAERDLPTF